MDMWVKPKLTVCDSVHLTPALLMGGQENDGPVFKYMKYLRPEGLNRALFLRKRVFSKRGY